MKKVRGIGKWVQKKVDMSTVKDMIDESIVGKLKEGNENIAQASEDIKDF